MSRPAPFHVFTPQRDQPEELEKILVKRHALLDSAVGKIRESVISPDKHRLLFIGPRGMGKSYLVTLIHHRLSMQEDLVEKMRFAWLNEDQTSTTFLHLLMRIYRKLAEQNPEEFPIGEIDAIRGKDPADAREILGQALIRHLGNRTVVLLIENLDAIFNSMSEVEQRTWRGFIQDHPCFAIVATAQGLTKDISSKAKPFFGFFDIHHLEPLTVDEAAELLEKIAALNDDQPLAEFIASSRGKARMRAIHHLSGGNPRLYLILSDFLTKDSLDNLVRLFEETVDRQLTPYFQERMRWLSPQQQEIVQFLCQQVHPASVKAISEGIFTKQNTVSGQLKQLREKGYLVAKGRGKESLYELAEPLMRLSFQVKEMNHRQPLTLIVDFMRVWYDRQDLEKRLEGILPGTWGRDYFEVALHKIDTEGNDFRHSLMLACIDDINCEDHDNRRLDELRGIAEETNSATAWIKFGQICLNSEKFLEGSQATTKAIELPNTPTFELAVALIIRAACQVNLGHNTEAIIDSNQAAEIPNLEGENQTMIFQGRAYVKLLMGDAHGAIVDLNQVIESSSKRQEVLVKALIDRGDAFDSLGDLESALKNYNQAAKLRNISIKDMAEVLSKRAFLFSRMKREKEAFNDCDKVVGMCGASFDSLAKALTVRAVCKIRKSDFVGAKTDLDHVCIINDCPALWKAVALHLRSAILRLGDDLEGAAADLSTAVNTHDSIAKIASIDLLHVYLDMEKYEKTLESTICLLSRPDSLGESHKTDQVELGIILTKVANGLRDTPSKWMAPLKQIIPLLVEREFTAGLSAALVQNLENLNQSDLNNTALDRWVSQWAEVTLDYPQLQMGVRMLRAGVEWIKTEDEGVLLDLVKEERAIVRQALGLEPERDD